MKIKDLENVLSMIKDKDIEIMIGYGDCKAEAKSIQECSGKLVIGTAFYEATESDYLGCALGVIVKLNKNK